MEDVVKVVVGMEVVLVLLFSLFIDFFNCKFIFFFIFVFIFVKIDYFLVFVFFKVLEYLSLVISFLCLGFKVLFFSSCRVLYFL